MNIQEEMSGATGMQQWNKGPRPRKVTMSRKYKGIQQQDRQTDFWTGDCEVSSWDFHQVAESE
jgi:hypothetical protein